MMTNLAGEQRAEPTTAVARAPHRSAPQRVLDVVRIQTVNWQSILLWPLGILAITFLINLAIFAAIGDTGQAQNTTGALMSIYIVVAIGYLQTMTQVFPFALGLSVTRRAFYTGTAALAVGESIFFGIVLTVLERLEMLTGGWGLRLSFFGLPFLVQDNVFAQWAVYTVPFLALSAISVFMGVVFKRWGQAGVYVVSITGGLIVAAAVLLVTWQQWWSSVGAFFTGNSTLSLFAVYPLVIAAVLGAAGYVAIRRATP